MGTNFGNITKTSFQADIKRKQAFFNRCKRRFKVAKTPSEKQFLKGEAKRIVTELKQSSKKWKTFGFGGTTWVTKNFSVTNFTSGKPTSGRKTAARKTTSCRTGARKTSCRKSTTRSSAKRRTAGSSKSRSVSRTRSGGSRRTFVAW